MLPKTDPTFRMAAAVWRRRWGNNSRRKLHRCQHVDGKHLLECRIGDLVEQAEIARARTVDQRIHTVATPADCAGAELRPVDGAGQVGDAVSKTVAMTTNLRGNSGRGCSQSGLVPTDQQHGCATTRQFRGYGATDATARTGDKRNGLVHFHALLRNAPVAGCRNSKAPEHVAIQPEDAARTADHRFAIGQRPSVFRGCRPGHRRAAGRVAHDCAGS